MNALFGMRGSRQDLRRSNHLLYGGIHLSSFSWFFLIKAYDFAIGTGTVYCCYTGWDLLTGFPDGKYLTSYLRCVGAFWTFRVIHSSNGPLGMDAFAALSVPAVKPATMLTLTLTLLLSVFPIEGPTSRMESSLGDWTQHSREVSHSASFSSLSTALASSVVLQRRGDHHLPLMQFV